MNARRFAVYLAVLLAAVLTVGQPAAHAQNAETVFERLLNRYERISALRAEFTQTMTSAFADVEESYTGRLILQGDKYRVETSNEVLVVDGASVHVYRPHEKQLLINDVVNDENAISPTDFLLHYDARFDVASVEEVLLEGEQHYRILLTPKDPDSFFREATLWMRERDDLITRLEISDLNETRMVFTLKLIELNPVLDADTFILRPPPGVEIIDLRS